MYKPSKQLKEKMKQRANPAYNSSGNMQVSSGGLGWTAITPVTVKGGVVRVIDNATGDIAMTTSGWIEDEKYGWWAQQKATAWSAKFDSTVTRTGRLTLKVSLTNVTGKAILTILPADPASVSVTIPQLSKYTIPVIGSTSYRFNGYVKTNNIVSAAVIQIIEYNAAGTKIVTNSCNSVGSTVDWTLETKTFTTNSATVGIIIILILNTAGNIADAWFDVNSMTLEEVSTITNSGSSPALFYPKVTAVSSTNNIDQSQVVKTNSTSLGKVTAGVPFLSQSITFSKKNFTGISLWVQKQGIPTDNLVITLEGQSSDIPNGTIYATANLNGADIAAGASAEYTLVLPYTVSIAKYAIKIARDGSADNTNYYIVLRDASQSYTAGVGKYYDTSWRSLASLYFKTLYSKNTTNLTVSTATETVSVTAPTTDGWADGTFVNVILEGNNTPLTLAPGVNNVYYSSNGAKTADGNVDASLQAILGGDYA